MKYRQIKAGSGAKCISGSKCPNYDQQKDWSQFPIKRLQYAIDLDGRGFVCNNCAADYLNRKYKELFDIAKQVIAQGDVNMTETIIYALAGDVDNIVEKK